MFVRFWCFLQRLKTFYRMTESVVEDERRPNGGNQTKMLTYKTVSIPSSRVELFHPYEEIWTEMWRRKNCRNLEGYKGYVSIRLVVGLSFFQGPTPIGPPLNVISEYRFFRISFRS